MRLDVTHVQPHHFSVHSTLKFTALAAFLSLVYAPTSDAQGRSGDPPRKVAERVLAAEASADWKTLIALSDPRSVDWFKKWHLALARLDTASDNAGMLRYLFAVSSATELEALPADSVLARFLRAVNPSRKDDQLNPRPRRTIVGEVLEGDTAAHIVYRTRIRPPSTPDESSAIDDLAVREWLQVLSLRRTPAGWRAWLTTPLMSARLPARRDSLPE